MWVPLLTGPLGPEIHASLAFEAFPWGSFDYLTLHIEWFTCPLAEFPELPKNFSFNTHLLTELLLCAVPRARANLVMKTNQSHHGRGEVPENNHKINRCNLSGD